MTSEPDQVAYVAAIEEVLASSGSDEASVQIVAVASAGATRSTLLVDIVQGDVVLEAVAQLRTIESTAVLADAATEAALLTLAAEAAVPAARLIAAGYAEPIGAEVLIASRIPGETIPRRVLRMLESVDGSAKRLTAQCGDALARLHAMALGSQGPGLAALGTPQHPGAYLDLLEESLDQLGHPYPVFRYGLRYLRTILPQEQAEVSLIHGDFRNGNLIVDDNGLAAVLDWELAHRGDPMEDLAWLCLRFWRFGNDDLPVGGFGLLEDLKAAYEGAGGRWRQDAFDWWTMARTIWWGQGLAAQAKRFTDGESNSIVHAASGRRVVELEYDLLTLIGEHRGIGEHSGF